MSRRLIPGAAALLGISTSLALACAGSGGEGSGAADDEEPRDIRLVVLVAVDQLRPDRLSGSMPGGLGRLVNDGRAFVEAALEHAFTETCPGHAVMLTGRHPSRVGIPANSWLDPETLEKRYCVEDRTREGVLVGARGAPGKPEDGRSGAVLRSSALGDWMKSSDESSRVFAVSGKDRAAITMAGMGPDAAYWLVRGAEPAWVTSRYYQKTLPAWVGGWRPEQILGGLPQDWVYLPETVRDAGKAPRPDDYRHESPMLSRTQPHPLLREPRHVHDRARHPADRLYPTPFADRVTLAFAKSLVENEGLGLGDGPDLLALGLSATDVVGHLYGPESWEAWDALTRLDRMLGDFFDFLDRHVGEDRYVVVLTADHGVLTLPQWLQETKRSQCRVPGGRVDLDGMLERLEAFLDSKLRGAGEGPWFRSRGEQLHLVPSRVAGDPAIRARVMALATTWLESQPGVGRVWTAEEVLAGEGPEPMATFYRNSWVEGLSGDLSIQVAEDCLLGTWIPTSHGSPHLYDRAVPLVFMGPDVDAGKIYDKAASPVDIAPTLASYLEIPAPVGLDGKVLPLRER